MGFELKIINKSLENSNSNKYKVLEQVFGRVYFFGCINATRIMSKTSCRNSNLQVDIGNMSSTSGESGILINWLIVLQVDTIILNKIWFSDNESCKYNGLSKEDMMHFFVAVMTKGENRLVRNLWPSYRSLRTPPGKTGVHSGLIKIVFDVQVKNGCLFIINQYYDNFRIYV